MKLRIKNTSLTTKILAWIQIIGGIYGIGVVSWLTINLGDINGAVLFIVLLGFSLFILSITAGSKLLNKDKLKHGLILSIINQSLQIFQFQILGYSFMYSSGTELKIGFNKALKLDFSLISSEYSMAINTDETDIIFMLNIFAIFMIVIMVDIWLEMSNKNKHEISDQTVENNNTMANNGYKQ